MRTNGARDFPSLRQKEKLDNHTTTQPHKLMNKEQSQLFFAPSLMLQINVGLLKWPPDQGSTKQLH